MPLEDKIDDIWRRLASMSEKFEEFERRLEVLEAWMGRFEVR